MEKSFDKDLHNLGDLRVDLAEYFGEEKKKFKLQECIGTLSSFCDRVQTCQKVSTQTSHNISEKWMLAVSNIFLFAQENETRKVQEAKAEQRKLEQSQTKAPKLSSNYM